MGILDGGKSEQIKALQKENQRILNRLGKLEERTIEISKEVSFRAPEAEREAKGHSLKAAEFRNRTEKKLEEANELMEKISIVMQNAASASIQLFEKQKEIQDRKDLAEGYLNRIIEFDNTFGEQLKVLEDKISTLDKYFEDYPDFEATLQRIDEFIAATEENKQKSNATLNEINRKRREIDNIYREIFGYKEKNEETGEVTEVEGLRDELNNAYEELSNAIEGSLNKLELQNKKSIENYTEFEGKYKEKYDKIIGEIRSLLPNALTAGLSSAFSEKKNEEVLNAKQLQKRFDLGIYMMVAVSILPMVVSIIFLIQELSLEEVINRLPRLVLAITPMYIPVLWFTYSANRKLNLSKRLIEEYAHKEVLSKTYEGLSNQISNINEKDQSELLKFKLLANFLQVSSENPGKLISNYQASDHPVMEALEQSYKLQSALEHLENIPGLRRIADILYKNSQNALNEKKKKIEEVLSINEGEDNPQNV